MEPSIEKKLTELFLSNAELLDEGQSPLLTRPRRAALEALNLLGIPPKGPGNGDRYHYTDLRGVFGEEWEHYFTPSHPGVAPDDLPGQMHRMKFLNGFCCGARHLTRLAVAGRRCARISRIGRKILQYPPARPWQCGGRTDGGFRAGRSVRLCPQGDSCRAAVCGRVRPLR